MMIKVFVQNVKRISCLATTINAFAKKAFNLIQDNVYLAAIKTVPVAQLQLQHAVFAR